MIDFGVEGSPYLVMDYVTGRTLRDLMLEGRLPAARAIRLGEQLLAGLAHAHEQGIVHRDLKPENLILSEEAGLKEHLRILDFGLAKLRDGPQMTAGMAVGTPSYMSPEQSGAEGAIDARTDLYAVGIVLFEMLTGRKPFQSDNVGEVILMQRESPPPKLRATVPEAKYSLELETLLDKAMSKLPEDRFQSAAELAAALASTPEGKAAGSDVSVAKPSGKAAEAPKADGQAASARAARRIAPGRRRLRRSARTPRRPSTRCPRSAAGCETGKEASASGQPARGRPAGVDRRAVRDRGVAGAAHRPRADAASRRERDCRRPSALGTAAAGTPAAVAPSAAARPRRGPTARSWNRHARWSGGARPMRPSRCSISSAPQQPDNAEVPYLLAMIYFDNRRWADGACGGADRRCARTRALKSTRT